MTPSEFRAARLAMGMTQRQLAAALEVTLRAVQHWEAGERGIPGPVRVAMRMLAGSWTARGTMAWVER